MRMEQRKEVRVRRRCNVQLRVSGGDIIAALLCNVSKSGASVDVGQWVDVGSRVRIDGGGLAFEGNVRYCQPSLYGYRLGIS